VSSGEERPPVGTNQLLNRNQLRYCLAEQIRLKAALNSIDASNQSQIDRYNEMVDDYNGRCDYLANLKTLGSIREELEGRRSELEAEGRDRFR
jgi:hypothetical protein